MVPYLQKAHQRSPSFFKQASGLCGQCCNSRAVMCSSAFSEVWAGASQHPACLWHCEHSWGNRGDKGCLTSTCPHAGFYRFSIYRSVKHSIIYTSELIQLFLGICCSCLLLWVLNFCLRTRAVAECGWIWS